MFPRSRMIVTMGQRQQYYQRVKNLFGANLIGYWPLWETSGTVAQDISGNGRNAAYETATLANAQSPARKLCPSLPGTSGNVNVYSASYAAAFNGQEGTIIVWAKVSGAGIWTDGLEREAFLLWVNGSNYISVRRSNAAGQDNRLLAIHDGAGTYRAWGSLGPSLDWMCLGLTYSVANSRAQFYINGMPSGAVAVPGAFTGAPSANYNRFGSSWGGNGWGGWLSDCIIANREATAAEMWNLCQWAYDPANRIVILGDSISTVDNTGWQDVVTVTNRYVRKNYAVGGHSVITNMDAQVTSSINDHANKIVIELGTNDTNGGDMNALQAECEENIAELRSYHPAARIYWLNVLPRWTDNTGATPVDKSNIRTAIAAACTAQGVTCWDTFTTPWITADQTSDGVHPTAAGHAAIAAQVLARL